MGEPEASEAKKKTIHVYGYGHAGSRHAKILRDALGCAVWVFDRDDKALARAEKDGFAACYPGGGAKREDHCDGVVIAVPPETQITVVGMALEWYECPIFCEKPLYNSISGKLGFAGICEIAKDPNRVTVGFQLRATNSLRHIVDQYKNCDHFVIRDWQNMATWPKASYGRDLLAEFSHEVDLAAWIMPDFQHVVAKFERAGKLYVKIMASTGQTCNISIDANHDGYQRGLVADAYSWTFSKDENDDAYAEQLRAWLDNRPYCTLEHVAKTKRLHDKIMASLQELKWLGA